MILCHCEGLIKIVMGYLSKDNQSNSIRVREAIVDQVSITSYCHTLALIQLESSELFLKLQL